MSTPEGLCIEMGGKEERGLAPRLPTPLPAGPSTLRARPGATAELEPGEKPACPSLPSLDGARPIPCFVFFLSS